MERSDAGSGHGASSTLAVVGATAVIAQPEPDEVTLPLGLRPVTEARSFVRDLAIVDELHLARLEVEVHPQIRAIHGAIELVQGHRALGVEGHTGKSLAVAHLEAGEPPVQPARVDLEDRMMRDHGVADL